MGPLFVAVIWIAVILVVASLGFLLAWLVGRSIANSHPQRRLVVWEAGLLPTAVLIYIIACILIFNFVQIERGRQWRWGSGSKADILLVGHYHLQQESDGSESAVLYSDISQDHAASNSRIGSISGLDIHAPFIFGRIVAPDPTYFMLDTTTGVRSDVTSLESLEKIAQSTRNSIKLVPVALIYDRQRNDSINLLIIIVFCSLPGAGLLWLGARVYGRLSKGRGYFTMTCI